MEAPSRVRNFGYMPDESNLLPGDLLLVSTTRWWHFSAHIICLAQRIGGCAPNSARWHHAAMYLGDGDVLEATALRGVCVSKLFDYCGRHCVLLFRRAPGLTEEERLLLCVRGMRFLSESYSWRSVLRIFGLSLFGFWNNILLPFARRAHICSQLYSDAYTNVLDDMVVARHPNNVLPAHLRFTDKLEDILVGWAEIVEE